MKKIIALAVMLVMAFSIGGCAVDEEKEMQKILKQFDLTDPKEPWMGTIDEDALVDDMVVVTMRKTATYPKLELRHFKLDNAKSMEYHDFKPSKDYSKDKTVQKRYVERFRQIVYIYLEHAGKENVIAAISELEKLDFVKKVTPQYRYYPA